MSKENHQLESVIKDLVSFIIRLTSAPDGEADAQVARADALKYISEKRLTGAPKSTRR